MKSVWGDRFRSAAEEATEPYRKLVSEISRSGDTSDAARWVLASAAIQAFDYRTAERAIDALLLSDSDAYVYAALCLRYQWKHRSDDLQRLNEMTLTLHRDHLLDLDF